MIFFHAKLLHGMVSFSKGVSSLSRLIFNYYRVLCEVFYNVVSKMFLFIVCFIVVIEI